MQNDCCKGNKLTKQNHPPRTEFFYKIRLTAGFSCNQSSPETFQSYLCTLTDRRKLYFQTFSCFSTSKSKFYITDNMAPKSRDCTLQTILDFEIECWFCYLCKVCYSVLFSMYTLFFQFPCSWRLVQQPGMQISSWNHNCC